MDSPQLQRANLFVLPMKPNPSAEAYLPTSDGPGGLTCGDMALAGEKHASVPCRPSMAARGGRVGMGRGRPGCQSGGSRYGGEREREEEEEEMEIGVCFYRGVSFSFLGAVATPFFGKISAKPCPRHDGLRRGLAASSVGRGLWPRRRVYKPLPPRATAGMIRIDQLAIFCIAREGYTYAVTPHCPHLLL